MRKNILRFISLSLSMIFLFPGVSLATSNKTDGFVFNDPVANTYVGRAEATRLISNLRFTDLPENPIAQDAIIRSGVLNMIKPFERQYNPNALLTNEEAIAFALRAAGMEDNAQTMGVAAINTLPEDSPLRFIWSIGYLQLARDRNLITVNDYNDALELDTSSLDPRFSFVRNAPVSRENFAHWLAEALRIVQNDVWTTNTSQQNIYAFNDWDQLDPERVNSMEHMLRNNIMNGRDPTHLDPKGTITRLEAAIVLSRLDKRHLGILNLERKSGTVAAVMDEQFNETGLGQAWRLVYVRAADGSIDLIQYGNTVSTSPQDGPLDAVVLRNGQVNGLQSLEVGDVIDYLIEPPDEVPDPNEEDTAATDAEPTSPNPPEVVVPNNGRVWYVNVTNETVTRTVQGRLQMVDIDRGTITFTDENGRFYTFPMVAGMYGTDDDVPFIRFSNEKRPLSSLPLGSLYHITVVNNVVTGIEFVGDVELQPETRGIVIDNNPNLGYLTILDSQRREVTKNYNAGSLRVQKRDHFDTRSHIGSIHSLFPDFHWNPLESDISSIEPGDIVSFRLDPDDPDRIVSISAAVNYTTRYGRISQFRDDDGIYQMQMNFENGVHAWFTVVPGTMLVKDGRPAALDRIEPGDWARMLVNQAVIGPGNMLESVKEIRVEGDGHHISTIVKGKIAGYNAIQNRMNIQDAQKLETNGWANYQQIEPFNISGRGITYYYDGRPVTLAYLNNYLTRADGDVYIALENNYAGERVRMVSIRTGRDELLKPDTVLASDNHGFTILSNDGHIETDEGTIVRRNGRLVDGSHIQGADFAVVSLNGFNKAAVVDITPAPATSGVQLIRGRVYSIDQGKTFKVQSMESFTGRGWQYAPIQREYTIDNNTLFIDNAGGITNINQFIDYTPDSVVNNLYTVVVDGGRAARVIDMPFMNENRESSLASRMVPIRGTIYAIEGNTVSILDAYYFDPRFGWRPVGSPVRNRVYDERTGLWSPVVDRPAGTIEIPGNSVIIDRNQVIGTNGLRVGQQINVMTNPGVENYQTGFTAHGYIVLVER